MRQLNFQRAAKTKKEEIDIKKKFILMKNYKFYFITENNCNGKINYYLF